MFNLKYKSILLVYKTIFHISYLKCNYVSFIFNYKLNQFIAPATIYVFCPQHQIRVNP